VSAFACPVVGRWKLGFHRSPIISNVVFPRTSLASPPATSCAIGPLPVLNPWIPPSLPLGLRSRRLVIRTPILEKVVLSRTSFTPKTQRHERSEAGHRPARSGRAPGDRPRPELSPKRASGREAARRCITVPAASSSLARAVRPWAATPPPWAGPKTGSPVVVRRRPWRRRSLPAAGGRASGARAGTVMHPRPGRGPGGESTKAQGGDLRGPSGLRVVVVNPVWLRLGRLMIRGFVGILPAPPLHAGVAGLEKGAATSLPRCGRAVWGG
jgi:hypothetical protein